LVEKVLTHEIKEKKKRLVVAAEGKEKKLHLLNRHRSIYIENITYRCLHCDEVHHDAMQRSGQYLHKCWVTMEAKQKQSSHEIKGKQLRWFSIFEKMEDCPWPHSGSCIQHIKPNSNGVGVSAIGVGIGIGTGVGIGIDIGEHSKSSSVPSDLKKKKLSSSQEKQMSHWKRSKGLTLHNLHFPDLKVIGIEEPQQQSEEVQEKTSHSNDAKKMTEQLENPTTNDVGVGISPLVEEKEHELVTPHAKPPPIKASQLAGDICASKYLDMMKRKKKKAQKWKIPLPSPKSNKKCIG